MSKDTVRGLVLMIAVAGCGEPEDVGTRLRRECTSIVRESTSETIADWDREYRIKQCIMKRGTITR